MASARSGAILTVGGAGVLSLLTMRGRPLGQTDQDAQFLNWAQIITVRDGKLTRIRSFLDRARGLEAAGLSEEELARSKDR